MGLRDEAAADLKEILEDATDGFGWPITLTDPDGNSANLVGLSSDIGYIIDPDTNQIVSGRHVSIALSLDSLEAASIGIPVGIIDQALAPWLVTMDDIQGQTWTFKVYKTMPDRAIGCIVCILELYKN